MDKDNQTNELLKELIKEIALLNATLSQELNEIRISLDNLVEIYNENVK